MSRVNFSSFNFANDYACFNNLGYCVSLKGQTNIKLILYEIVVCFIIF